MESSKTSWKKPFSYSKRLLVAFEKHAESEIYKLLLIIVNTIIFIIFVIDFSFNSIEKNLEVFSQEFFMKREPEYQPFCRKEKERNFKSKQVR